MSANQRARLALSSANWAQVALRHVSIGGAATGVVLSNGLLVVAIGDRIETYLFDKPGQEWIRRDSLVSDYVFDHIVELDDNIYAVVGNGTDRLLRGFTSGYIAQLTVDIRGTAQWIGATPSLGSVYNLAGIGNDLIVISSSKGLRLLDVSDITKPKEVSSIVLSGDIARGIVVKDEVLFASVERGQMMGGYLISIDLRDPNRPSELSRLGSTAPLQALHLTENDHLVAGTGYLSWTSIESDTGILIIDVSDPSHPRIAETITIGTTIFDVCVASNNTIYALGVGTGGRFSAATLYRVSKEGGDRYRIDGQINTLDGRAIGCNKEHVALADGSNGVKMYEVNDVSLKSVVIATSVEAWSAVVHNNVLIIGGSSNDVFLSQLTKQADDSDELPGLGILRRMNSGDGGAVKALRVAGDSLYVGFDQDLRLALTGVDIYQIGADMSLIRKSHTLIQPDEQPGSVEDVVVIDNTVAIAGGFTGLVGLTTVKDYELSKITWFDVTREVYDLASDGSSFLAAVNTSRLPAFHFDGLNAVMDEPRVFPLRVEMLERADHTWLYVTPDGGVVLDNGMQQRRIYNMTPSAIYYDDGLAYVAGNDTDGPMAIIVDTLSAKIVTVVRTPSAVRDVWGNRQFVVLATSDAGAGMYPIVWENSECASCTQFIPIALIRR